MCFRFFKRARSLLLTGLVVMLVAAGAAAQNKTGGIDGLVIDVMGAAVPQAKIVITTGANSRSLETDEWGKFHADVPVGISRISVERAGFKVAKLNRVRVVAGASRSLKIVLTVRPLKYGKCPKGQTCIWL